MSGIGRPQNDECCVIPLVRGAQRTQSHEIRKWKGGCQGPGEGMESCLMGAGLQLARRRVLMVTVDAVAAQYRGTAPPTTSGWRPGRVSRVVGASSWAPEGYGFGRCFPLTSMFLLLSLPLPLSLKSMIVSLVRIFFLS